ncbi:Uncharacterized protein OBRU01_19867 [Operophtera brumata]|uniref:Regulatory protein zeste n=1 Tax=Operophtera brumata TaxID=104452 RepID=A0A0L7KWF8_OPEBR|nr:Uncharacterized protein OBRU01_19867 [Operophtera brumata]
MSGNSQQSNKDRSSNFCKEESNKLVLLMKDSHVINNKKTDHASNTQKEAAWRLLPDKFNSDATRYRSTKQLQQKYNNMKKNCKKGTCLEKAAEKYGRRLTGGGPAPPQPSETTDWLNSIMGESISGLQAVYDSDALECTAVDVVPDTVDTTAKVNLDLSNNTFDEECK